MPISYSCPHCGKQFSVADQYAGQSGPCAACGQTITIPQGAFPPAQAAFTPGYYAPRPASGGSGASVAVIIVAVLAVLLCCPGVLIALLLPAVQAAREAARRSASTNNMRQIGIALMNYHDTYNEFPPAVVTDPNGKPLYSGRVLLLPFLEQENLYRQWDASQAWDSPANQGISQTNIATFVDPSDPGGHHGQSSYTFITGTGTMFEPGQKIRLTGVTDGTSNTMTMIEMRGTGQSWAAPDQLDINQLAAGLPQGNHPGGNLVLMADGSARFVSKSVAPQVLSAMATRNGGENVQLP